MQRLIVFLLVLLVALPLRASTAPATDASNVVQSTLRNGLRVVIVPNSLAPVVSTDLVYLVGSRDDPEDVPGMAHAQEHMMFRGTPNLSTAQLGTIATALGGAFNASTADTTTRYEFTVPNTQLDSVLRIESDRMRGVLDLQREWATERGAIEQEVVADEQSPGSDFFVAARRLAFAGTPYAHDGVGTRPAFDALQGPRIKAFFDRWYAPNNAVLVIAGDVDPQRALAQVRARFESIPRKAIPAHASARLAPLNRVVLKRGTTLAYPLAVAGYRFPGINDRDFLASYVLQGVLGADRGALHALADRGEVLDAQWVSQPYLPEAQLAFAVTALRPGSDPSAAAQRLESLLAGIARSGVPAELFATTKRRLIAQQELSRSSIEALADDWATTIAVDGEPSIAREQQLIANVTLADVNRVARRVLDPAHAIVGALTPSSGASQTGAAAPVSLGREAPLAAQSTAVKLPDWGERLLHDVQVPPKRNAPADRRLNNGMRVIVAPATISDSVVVSGRVRTIPGLQEPPGKEGVARVLDAMFAYGTRRLDRIAFIRAQDAIDTELGSGLSFGMRTTSKQFDRAVALLAEGELQPRFDEATFKVAQQRVLDALQTDLNSSRGVVTRQADAKLLPAGDPQLRQPTVASLNAVSLDDVKAYYAKVMRPDLTSVVVAGNVTPDRARRALESAFARWHADGEAPKLDLPPVVPNAPGEVRLNLSAMRQTNVVLTELIPISRTSPQFYPLELGNAVLGGGAVGPQQSRLFRDIRQNAGLVYSIGSGFNRAANRATFEIQFACDPGNEQRIESLIGDEILRMQREPVDAEELALMKASIVRRTTIASAEVNGIVEALLGDATNNLPLDQQRIDAQTYLTTDARAVQEAFANVIRPNGFVKIVQGP